MSSPGRSDLAKRWWWACVIASVVYIVAFLLAATRLDVRLGQGLTEGFCVWGEPTIPGAGEKCPEAWQSHRLAWLIDLGFTLAAVLLYFRRREKLLIHIGIAVVIFFHGALHKLFSHYQCLLVTAAEGDRVVNMLGSVGYILYTAMLVVAAMRLGFPNMPLTRLLIIVVLTSGATFFFTKIITPEYSLSVLFAVSHPLVAVTGLLSHEPTLTGQLAFVFFLATLVGLIELVACSTFLVFVWGHAWYDIVLHAAMITQLITAPSKSKTG